MKLKRNALRNAVVLAIMVSATGFAGTVAAQDPPEAKADEATELDAVQVTGSRIAIPGLTTNSPIMTVERAEIDRIQPVAAEDFLKQQPSAVPAMGPGMNNGTGGAATLDLRGLGANRTLVLLDGRRLVPYDLNGIVDTNIIPVSLLESVDLVTGGASAVYGADAISGVANFVLRRNFTGMEVSAFYGQSDEADGAKWRSDVTVGADFEDGRGNVALSVGRSETDPLFQGERDYALYSLRSQDGTRQGSGTTVPTYIDGPGKILDYQVDPVTGLPLADYTSYNFNPVNYYQTGLDRQQGTAIGRYEITDKAEAYAQLLYTRSEVASRLAPSGTFLNDFTMPIGNEFIPDAVRQDICDDLDQAIAIATAAGDPNPPTPITNCEAGSSELVTMTIGRRFTEMGDRLSNYENRTLQYTLGVRGDFNDQWRYDSYWTHGESSQVQVRTNWGSFSKVSQALNALDQNGDGTPDCLDPSQGCVPLNLFTGNITPEMLAFIDQDAVLLQDVTQDIFSASVSGDLGDTFKSPWADYPIGLVFGIEDRKVHAWTRSDTPSQIGDVLGTGGASPNVNGRIGLQEFYTEFLVPLVSNRPGIQSLNLEGGYRRSSFDVSGGGGSQNYGTWKYGLEWAPIESLRFRGMFQHAVRAPNINELFFPATTGLDNRGTDPCANDALLASNATVAGTLEYLCAQTGVPIAQLGGDPATTFDEGLKQPSAGQVNALFSGNPNLSPEQADTQTIGLVWTPNLGGNELALTVDYWKIELEERIGTFTADDIIDGCYDAAKNPGLDPNNVFCGLLGRNTSNGSWNGNAVGVAEVNNNLGNLETDGFDIGARYGFPIGSSRLDFAIDATHVRKINTQATPISDVHECVGNYSVACVNLTPEWKFNQRTTWTHGALELGLNWRYISAMTVEEDSGDWYAPFTSIDSYSYFDLSAAWRTPFGARITLTVNNVADKDPPIVGNTIGTTSQNSGNTFPQVYDVLGRFYTLGINWKF